MTKSNCISFLLLICIIYIPGVWATTLDLDTMHIKISNFHDYKYGAPGSHCITYKIHDSGDNNAYIAKGLFDQFCRVPDLPYTLKHLNLVVNTSEETIVNVQILEVEIVISEFKNTVLFDGKSIHPSFNISSLKVYDHVYPKEPTAFCPSLGNGNTSGAISFIDWNITTDIEITNSVRGCRNEDESIITIRNSDCISLKHMLFEDNIQSPLLIIDSNVTVVNCTMRNNLQYYNKIHKSTGLTRYVRRGFSLGITIIMTNDSESTNHVGISDSIFENNRCLKKNESSYCVHKVKNNAIPTSYFAGAIGIVIASNTGFIEIRGTRFHNNTACDSGGGVFTQVFDGMTDGELKISNSNFTSNTAGYLGGGLHMMQDVGAYNFLLALEFNNFESNQGCIAGGAIGMLVTDTGHKFDLIKDYTNQRNEHISFAYAESTKFSWNYSGRLSSGHAAYLKAYGSPAKRQFPILTFNDCKFDANHRPNSNPNGFTFGSIMADNFILYFTGNNSIMNSNSGGILQIQSIVFVNGSLTFQNLSAYAGGAIHARKWSKLMLTDNSDILFKNNSASIAGGAIFHYYGNWNGYSGSNIYNTYCLLGYFPSIREDPTQWKARVRFEGNDAGEAGGAVFLTDLRQCALVDGKIQLRKAFNFTSNFTFSKNTVAQGRYNYISDSDTYGDIASPVVMLEKLRHVPKSIDRGPGIERPLTLKPIDQLNQTTIAVVTIRPMSPYVKLENENKVITQKDINDYNKCEETNRNTKMDEDCLDQMPYIKYTVKPHFNDASIQFKYTIQSGVESISVDDDYYENDIFTIDDPYCDIGYTLDEDEGKCVCNAGNDGIVRCSAAGKVYIKPGYWGIKKQEANSSFKLTSAIAKCAHSTCTCEDNSYNCPITDNPNVQCVPELNVEGDLCGACKKNYTTIPFSIQCVRAPAQNRHELMAAYVAMTLICACLIIIFRCKLWNGFRIIFIVLYALTYINYSFNFALHAHTLRAIQTLQGLSILNFYLIYPAYNDIVFAQTELISLYPVFTILSVLVMFAVLSAISYKFPASSFHHKFKLRRLVSPGLILWYMMSISLFRVFLDYAYCIKVVNNSTEKESIQHRNRFDGTVLCYTTQDNYIYYLMGITFATSILVIPIPLLLAVGALKRNTTKSYTLNKLIIPFRPIGRFHWAWEFFRFIALAIGFAMHDVIPKIGNAFLMTKIAFLTIVHIHFWPYKEWSSNIIECIGWILLSLIFIINHKVSMEPGLDKFQLILIILLFVLVACSLIVYVVWKIFTKLKKDKIQTSLKKILNRYSHIPMVKTCSRMLDKKLNESDEEVTADEVREVEKPKTSDSESLYRRDSIFSDLSFAQIPNS